MLLYSFCLEIYLRCIKIALMALLSQSLTEAINQAKRTVKVKRPTLLLHKFAGACKVINWGGGGVFGADHQPAIWCYLQLFLESKLNFLRNDFGY